MKDQPANLKPGPGRPTIAACIWALWLGLGLTGIGLVTFFSLRSTPAISTVNWVPRWLAHWADRNYRFDNFPAYGLMALPFLLLANTFRRRAWTVVALSFLIFFLELAQLAEPHRHCDVGDMACGWAGVLTAWALCTALDRLLARLGLKPVNAP